MYANRDACFYHFHLREGRSLVLSKSPSLGSAQPPTKAVHGLPGGPLGSGSWGPCDLEGGSSSEWAGSPFHRWGVEAGRVESLAQVCTAALPQAPPSSYLLVTCRFPCSEGRARPRRGLHFGDAPARSLQKPAPGHHHLPPHRHPGVRADEPGLLHHAVP